MTSREIGHRDPDVRGMWLCIEMELKGTDPVTAGLKYATGVGKGAGESGGLLEEVNAELSLEG